MLPWGHLREGLGKATTYVRNRGNRGQDTNPTAWLGLVFL